MRVLLHLGCSATNRRHGPSPVALSFHTHRSLETHRNAFFADSHTVRSTSRRKSIFLHLQCLGDISLKARSANEIEKRYFNARMCQLPRYISRKRYKPIQQRSPLLMVERRPTLTSKVSQHAITISSHSSPPNRAASQQEGSVHVCTSKAWITSRRQCTLASNRPAIRKPPQTALTKIPPPSPSHIPQSIIIGTPP